MEHVESSANPSPASKIQAVEGHTEPYSNQQRDGRDKILDSLVEKRAHELLTEALSRSFKDLYGSDRPNEK